MVAGPAIRHGEARDSDGQDRAPYAACTLRPPGAGRPGRRVGQLARSQSRRCLARDRARRVLVHRRRQPDLAGRLLRSLDGGGVRRPRLRHRPGRRGHPAPGGRRLLERRDRRASLAVALHAAQHLRALATAGLGLGGGRHRDRLSLRPYLRRRPHRPRPRRASGLAVAAGRGHRPHLRLRRPHTHADRRREPGHPGGDQHQLGRHGRPAEHALLGVRQAHRRSALRSQAVTPHPRCQHPVDAHRGGDRRRAAAHRRQLRRLGLRRAGEDGREGVGVPGQQGGAQRRRRHRRQADLCLAQRGEPGRRSDGPHGGHRRHRPRRGHHRRR